jgi:hypothetical protein
MKYLVVKGWLGFGDRLESLKTCVKIAMDNNLRIYVDWTDSMWSHGTESFYSYFKLVGIPQLASLDDIPADASCFPECWNGKIKEPFSDEFGGNNPDCSLNLLKPEEILKNEADVLVVSVIGIRPLYHKKSHHGDSTFFANVFRVIHPQILSEVKNRQKIYNLKDSAGVHIRGTDRIRNSRMRDLPIQWLAFSANNQRSFKSGPIIAVSDDPKSFQTWKNFFPQTKILSSLSVQTDSNKGIHNLKKEELKVSKDAANIDSLIDFFTLASCQHIISTYSESRFFLEALRLGPFVNTILSS